MNWISDNANWVALGLLIFFGVFVIGFFVRNHAAKTDETGKQEKQTEESNIGIKRSDK